MGAGRRHIEPQRERRAGFDEPQPLGGRKRFRRPRIKRRAVGIARPWSVRFALCHQPCDLGAAFKARIDQALRRQSVYRAAIIRKMLRLPPHRRFPDDAEPAEVLVNRGLEFRPAARGVDILDAQQKPPAAPARQVEIQQRRKSMAEVEVAVRTRRKSENGGRHYIGLVMPGLVPGIHVFSICIGPCCHSRKSCSTK